MKKVLLIIACVILSFILLIAFSINILKNYIATKSTEITLSAMMDVIKNTNYEAAQKVKLENPFTTDNNKIVSVSINQGILNIGGTQNSSNIEGEIFYTSEIVPQINIINENNYEIFKIVHLDQSPQKQNLVIPNSLPIEELNIGMGAGISNIDVSDSNVKTLNIGMGMGEATIHVPVLNNSKINLSNPAGKTKIFIPANIGFKVSTTNKFDIPNAKYDENNQSYISNNYESSETKTEINLGNIVGTVDIVNN